MGQAELVVKLEQWVELCQVKAGAVLQAAVRVTAWTGEWRRLEEQLSSGRWERAEHPELQQGQGFSFSFVDWGNSEMQLIHRPRFSQDSDGDHCGSFRTMGTAPGSEHTVQQFFTLFLILLSSSLSVSLCPSFPLLLPFTI